MTRNQEVVIKPVLNMFENEDIKNFAKIVISDFPDYIWEVGASSTGKYHPSYTLGKLGLIKHMIAVARFVNFFLELDQYKSIFTSRERDLIRLAALIHDGRKSGSQEDYKNNKHTKFAHPIMMAKEITNYSNKNMLPENELVYIARIIAKHMGQWNTSKDNAITLPKPNDKASELVHLADYLASRKCICMNFDDLYSIYYSQKET